MAIAYDNAMKNPLWSAVKVTHKQLSIDYRKRRSHPRPTSFFPDPDLRRAGVEQAPPFSHAFSIKWNRGHLTPNKILAYSASAQEATFTMANVAPQAGPFNSGPWRFLEQDVFDWIQQKRDLYIITGVIQKSRTRPIRSADGVAVPIAYYKVLCDPATKNSVGFIGQNRPDGRGTKRMVPVMEIEQLLAANAQSSEAILFPYEKCHTNKVDPNNWWRKGYTVSQVVYPIPTRGLAYIAGNQSDKGEYINTTHPHLPPPIIPNVSPPSTAKGWSTIKRTFSAILTWLKGFFFSVDTSSTIVGKKRSTPTQALSGHANAFFPTPQHRTGHRTVFEKRFIAFQLQSALMALLTILVTLTAPLVFILVKPISLAAFSH